MYILILIAGAFVLDLIFGDPRFLPHPICWIGKLISVSEKFLRKAVKNNLIGGVFLVLIVCTFCFAIPYFLLFGLKLISREAAFILELFWCYQILATKSLRVESMKVYTALKEKGIEEGRKFLSYIVGRDTENLDEKSVVKATVETIAENTTDGVIAPLIFMAIGGAPLAFLYKGINTMDSMVGYKNEKYILFGRAAAYLDDVANFIPARISAVFMIIASAFCGFNAKNALKIYKRDRRNHKSPNSAQTESVCAGALEIELAGDAVYFGKKVEKPTIGDDIRPIELDDIKRANLLMTITSVLSVVVILSIHLTVFLLIGR